MNKYILCSLILFSSTAVFADILLSPQEEVRIRTEMAEGQKKCPANKPLFDGENCYSCDEPQTVHAGRYAKCSEVCPNRKERYECGPSCVLQNAPGPDYMYVQCEGWVKKCTSGFQGEDGKCYTCSDVEALRGKGEYDNGIMISQKDCLSCRNTQYIDGYGCAPACPKNNPLFVDGRCASCTLTERSGYVLAGCDKCANRFEYNDGCYLKCPKDKPILDLWDGKCYSCSYKGFQKPDNPSNDMVLGCLKCRNKIYNVRCMDIEEQEYQ